MIIADPGKTALAVFLVIKGINHMKREKEAPPAEPTAKDCPFCFTSIPIQASRCHPLHLVVNVGIRAGMVQGGFVVARKRSLSLTKN